MDEWEDWRYLFRVYFNAQISGPAGVPEEHKDSEQQIDLFSEICRPDVNYNECIKMMKQTILVLFNYTHDTSFSYSEYQGKYICYIFSF